MVDYSLRGQFEEKDITIETVKSVYKQNFPKSSLAIIDKAYEFASKAHEGQLRKTGEKYITHPLFVAYLTASIKLDGSAIAAALLHDTVEDTTVTLEDIKNEFGEETAFLVDGLTKIRQVTNRVQHNAEEFESIRKLLIASTKDVRVILIKLADRLHNTLTIDGLPPARRITYSLENLKFYAPLADFVGINIFRKKLEDYSFKEIEPQKYAQISGYLNENLIPEDGEFLPREEYMNNKVEAFLQILKENKIKASVYGRHKGIYSIYRKIVRKYKEFDIERMKDINDLIGITILVQSIPECYRVLGLMHANFDHQASLFDDYIAKPKGNGYRAIHTNLIMSSNAKIALQIKTYKMHEYNEYGPASHIYYKEKEKGFENILSSKLTFLKSLVRWKEIASNIEQYKVDVFKDKVFVFTPKGDVKELPKGATAIDFAYLVHTNVGNSCKGVKVNGAIKPLNYELATGDVVEVMTHKKPSMPSPDWINYARTSYAKSRIKRELRSSEEEQYEEVNEIVENEIEETETKEVIKTVKAEDSYVKIKNIENIDTTLAKCCSPIPGDDIIGHVTKSRGIRIHRKDCKELSLLDYKVLLDAEWSVSNKEFLSGLFIQSKCSDNAQMVKDISKVMSDMKVGLQKVDAWDNNGFQARVSVKVTSKSQLETLIKKLRKIHSVSSVQRMQVLDLN